MSFFSIGDTEFPTDYSQFNLSSFSGDEDKSELLEARRITQWQALEAKRAQRALEQSEHDSKKWRKTQLEIVSTIRNAELESKRYELERNQAEMEAEIAAKQAEVDEESLEIQKSIGDLLVEAQTLEYDLSEIKEQRKRNLLFIRTEIESSMRDLAKKETAHDLQVSELKTALSALQIHHQQEITTTQDDHATEISIVEHDIAELTETISRSKESLVGVDDSHQARMNDMLQSIEMMKNELEIANDKTEETLEELQEMRLKYSMLQRQFADAEEESRLLNEQLAYGEEQKKLIRTEINKLDRHLWDNQRATVLQQ